MNECEVCGSKNLTSFEAMERMYGLNDIFTYKECENCKGLFLSEIPENLSKYYPEEYYSFEPYKASSSLVEFIKKVRFEFWKRGINFKPPNYFTWLSNLKVEQTSKIADIGCGNGQLLAELSYCGFKNLDGYDPFLTNTGVTKGFTLIKKDFFEITEKYDLVMFHHSFEHIPNPEKIFNNLSTILNPGGEVLIRVPVTDGKVWQENREFWFQLDAPRHLFIPNTESIICLADKYSFEVIKIEFDSLESQFWGTELYRRGKPFVGTDIAKEFSKKEMDIFKTKASQFNKLKIGDQACFYLRKN
ncbi:class I SAM-dependent methyltransferase [Algoriphagus halophytocola]|uniref:Class I SAM-dependent methyltransferase n=1 Tax=Algoriphagus halophytocola TaxID=2991499 RepID=A0ABY6MCF9_9BACT|nr:class I SAM-dependent methyltransferase [Algoriphagus sp. TR-M5]UZD21372.1 class I SAM-dependent methyltransferase [Algoriphagus sp. TR-M5]